MHQMADQIQRETRRRKVRIAETAASVVSFAAVLVIAVLVPGILEKGTPEIIAQGMNASIFTSNSVLGLIVVGIIAFLLGVSLTVFCFRLKAWEEEKNSEIRYDR